MGMSQAVDPAPEPLYDLTPAAKLVYKVFENRDGKPMTSKQLAEATRMSRSTVRSGLRQLREAGLVKQRPVPRDARSNLYFPIAI